VTEQVDRSTDKLEFPVSSPPLKTGKNHLEVTVLSRNKHLTCSLVLSEVELLISYKKTSGHPLCPIENEDHK